MTGEVTQRVEGAPKHEIELWDNDGIVNTLSMFWLKGENVLVPADHMDIVGHYKPLHAKPGEGCTYQTYDLLKSNSGFSKKMFEDVWTEGRHENPGLTLSFAPSRQWVGYGMNHWNLLSQPLVYEQIRRWIASPRPKPSPNSAPKQTAARRKPCVQRHARICPARIESGAPFGRETNTDS